MINGKLVPSDAADDVADPLGEKGAVASYIEHLPGGASQRSSKPRATPALSTTRRGHEVPAGQLFMMGDNRDNSSRLARAGGPSGLGFVPVELVLGRVVAVL